MVTTRPMKIPGRWREGYALDHHTLSSIYIGDDEFGHPQFETKRSEVGELLYQLKYRGDETTIDSLVEAAAAFLTTWNLSIDLIVPIPPSRAREKQPVLLMAERIAQRLNLAYAPTCVSRSRDIPELKGVYEHGERARLLAGAHTIDKSQVAGKRVLLFDDLYRSGATMNEITAALYDAGAVQDVFALTISRTRSNQ